ASLTNALVPILLLTTQVLAILAGYLLGGFATALKFLVDNLLAPATRFVTGLYDKLAEFTHWLSDHLLEPWRHLSEIPGLIGRVFATVSTWLYNAGSQLIS